MVAGGRAVTAFWCCVSATVIHQCRNFSGFLVFEHLDNLWVVFSTTPRGRLLWRTRGRAWQLAADLRTLASSTFAVMKSRDILARKPRSTHPTSDDTKSKVVGTGDGSVHDGCDSPPHELHPRLDAGYLRPAFSRPLRDAKSKVSSSRAWSSGQPSSMSNYPHPNTTVRVRDGAARCIRRRAVPRSPRAARHIGSHGGVRVRVIRRC